MFGDAHILRKELEGFQKQIMDHRRRMLFELRSIFPIESPKMKGGHPTICSLQLPIIENFDFVPGKSCHDTRDAKKCHMPEIPSLNLTEKELRQRWDVLLICCV